MALLELIVIDAEDDREVGAGGRRRDQHALGAGLQMLRRVVALGEEARAFQRHVDAELLPRQLRRIALGRHLDRAAADVDAAVLGLHLAAERPVHGVVAQEMRVGFDRAEIVDADDLDVAAVVLDDGAQDQTPDAPEAVDGDPDSHDTSLPLQPRLGCRDAAARR